MINQVGMKTSFAKYGSTEQITKSGADHDLNSISELVNIIKSYMFILNQIKISKREVLL